MNELLAVEQALEQARWNAYLEELEQFEKQQAETELYESENSEYLYMHKQGTITKIVDGDTV